MSLVHLLDDYQDRQLVSAPDTAASVNAFFNRPNPLALLNRVLVATTLLAALIMASAFWLGARNKSDDAWVVHSLAVRDQLVRVLNVVQSAETGQPGYLPRLLGNAKELRRPVPETTRMGTRGEIILVVEDDSLMRRLTTEALQELGYTVFDSENAGNALEVLDRIPEVKLLFTDVVMPDINGKKLADEAVRRRPGLKVLFTTGYTANAVVHGGVLDAGVNLIIKPFTLDQLAAKVRAVLDS